ncbi:MAG: hypothetical protein AB7W06_17395 [Alphaproteobacteria bacterium]
MKAKLVAVASHALYAAGAAAVGAVVGDLNLDPAQVKLVAQGALGVLTFLGLRTGLKLHQPT